MALSRGKTYLWEKGQKRCSKKVTEKGYGVLLPIVYTVQGYKSHTARLSPSLPPLPFTTLSMLFLHSTTTTTTLLLYPSLSPPSSGRSDQPESLNKPESRQCRAELTHTHTHTDSHSYSCSALRKVWWAAPAESEAEVGSMQLWVKITSPLCFIAVVKHSWPKEMYTFFLLFWLLSIWFACSVQCSKVRADVWIKFMF